MSSSLPPPAEYQPAKQAVDTIVNGANISSVTFATSPVCFIPLYYRLASLLYSALCQIYQAWETDSIISLELWRNLGLALLAVGLVSVLCSNLVHSTPLHCRHCCSPVRGSAWR